jgi:hypothetical protein
MTNEASQRPDHAATAGNSDITSQAEGAANMEAMFNSITALFNSRTKTRSELERLMFALIKILCTKLAGHPKLN